MSGFTGSPRLIKGGIVLLDPDTGAVVRVIALQYNPDSLSRTFQVKSVTADQPDHSEALRLKGPPVETIKIDAEIDATDQLASPDQNPLTVANGIHSQLAALELIIYPPSSQLIANNTLSNLGTLEIAPMQAPLALFVWSKSRVVPVRLTELSITEEAFDTALNPIRAKVSLGMRVLSVDDLGFDHKGGQIYMAYQIQKEALATQNTSPGISALGLGSLP